MSDQFACRPNPDGTIDFICRRCFATVATRSNDGSFNLGEDEHHCDPARLADFNCDRKAFLAG